MNSFGPRLRPANECMIAIGRMITRPESARNKISAAAVRIKNCWAWPPLRHCVGSDVDDFQAGDAFEFLLIQRRRWIVEAQSGDGVLQIAIANNHRVSIAGGE